MVATLMEAMLFKEKSRGKVWLIHFLVRCFAVAATILLLTDGSHAHADGVEMLGNDVDAPPPVQRTDVNSSEAILRDDQWRMVKTRGSQFVIGDRPFYVNGFNAYWLMILAADPSTRGRVTEVFQQAAAVGLTVCRTWGFNDGGWRALQKSPAVYDEDVFKALDFVVSEARKYRMRLILSLINNWDGYGGKAQYVKWARDAGLNLTSDDDFFSDQTVKGYFKNHVKNMLTRVNTYTNVTYKDDPTIFAWELMNEQRCTSDPTGNKLQAWIQEMAFHVKSIDPDHLLEVGAEGFYGPSSPARLQANPNTYAGQVGTDFIRNHRVLGVDFASVHIYPDTCRGCRRTSPTPRARSACRWCSRSSGCPPRPGAPSTRRRGTSSSRRCTGCSWTRRAVAAPERGPCSGRCSRRGRNTWTTATVLCCPKRRPPRGSCQRIPRGWWSSTPGARGAAAGGAGRRRSSRRLGGC
ncbi:mannan endo-1,4-beta-mannosidase 6 isoform X3 [Panicum hallii]|uniref:mannan endo-1,4-beta-mannosidase 6 isoform X3 n=1 Tax=Panicum hallii TaxID=206008 RepID=UPI000DF4E276|nr:mannan endo-1,4-beta-mannosidase 6 isoform X3 [Panicum hallii]